MAEDLYIKFEDVKKSIRHFSHEQLLEIHQEIHDYMETNQMIKSAETAFSEWNDTEEDTDTEVE